MGKPGRRNKNATRDTPARSKGAGNMSRVLQRDNGRDWRFDLKDVRGVRRRRKIGPSKRFAKQVLDGVLGNVARREHRGVVGEPAIKSCGCQPRRERRIGGRSHRAAFF